MSRISTAIKVQRNYYKIKKNLIRILGFSKQIYFEHRVKQYREIWKAVAAELNAEFQELSSSIWQITKDNASIRLLNYLLPLDNPVVLGLAGNKQVVHQLLQNKKIPIPDYLSFNLVELDKAYAFLTTHPAGCVVKPAEGYGGKGVTINITNNKSLRTAAIIASLYGSELLIEEQIVGECYRLLIFKGKLIHAVRRNGLRLVGDGDSSIEQLFNKDKPGILDARKSDRDINFTLNSQNMDWGYIPANGQSVLIKSKSLYDDEESELRTVYDETVTDRVCNEIIKDAEESANLVNSCFLGVDIIATSISEDLRKTGGTVNEVNTTPALHHHYFSSEERYPQVALTIIKTLLEEQKSTS